MEPPVNVTWRIGVAGWDYPDWSGRVYPAPLPRGFDRLAWVARWVDTIEVNATFYRPVAPATATSWLTRTRDRDRFRFTAKAHRSWTHDPHANLAVEIPATLSGLAPLHDAGRLGALLLQFPQRAHFDEELQRRIDEIATRAAGWPLVAEGRHTSWGTDAARAWLDACGIGWCVVDQPAAGNTTLGLVPTVLGDVAYLRLHGRNTRNWFHREAGRDERYDYRYSSAEIASLHAEVARPFAGAREAYVIQNNHFQGQALADALQWKALLETARVPAPEELVLAFPDLEAITDHPRTRLF